MNFIYLFAVFHHDMFIVIDILTVPRHIMRSLPANLLHFLTFKFSHNSVNYK